MQNAEALSLLRRGTRSLLAVEAVPLRARVTSFLDFSRWFAAALVLVYHVRLNVLVEDADVAAQFRGPVQRGVYLLTDCGPQAVIWFFVVSGFLVGGNVLSQVARGTFDVRAYALNRFTRLYIVLVPALVLGYALDLMRIDAFGLSAAGAESTRNYGFRAFVANLCNVQTILAPTLGSNKPLWSLAYEAWYYVLFPLVLAPFFVRSAARQCVAVLAALALTAFLAQNPTILAGFVIWLLGVAARMARRPLTASLALGWLAAGSLMVLYPILLPVLGGGAKLLVAAGFANILLTVRFTGGDSALPGAALHARLSGFSFSLYLVHAPALHAGLAWLTGRGAVALNLQPVGWEPLAWATGLFGGLVVYAFAFSRLTEVHTEAVRRHLQAWLRQVSSTVRAPRTRGSA